MTFIKHIQAAISRASTKVPDAVIILAAVIAFWFLSAFMFVWSMRDF
jgi:hypothetical protein